MPQLCLQYEPYECVLPGISLVGRSIPLSTQRIFQDLKAYPPHAHSPPRHLQYKVKCTHNTLIHHSSLLTSSIHQGPPNRMWSQGGAYMIASDSWNHCQSSFLHRAIDGLVQPFQHFIGQTQSHKECSPSAMTVLVDMNCESPLQIYQGRLKQLSWT